MPDDTYTDIHTIQGARLSDSWLQWLIQHKALSAPPQANISIGRSIIDGTLVIYPLDNPPAWLITALEDRDEDGNTSIGYPNIEEV
jgi:hypothetical protein